jgi:hypothetical protein
VNIVGIASSGLGAEAERLRFGLGVEKFYDAEGLNLPSQEKRLIKINFYSTA